MKTILPLFLALILLTSIQSFAQRQKGSDIFGDTAYNRLGWSINMPDAKTLAVGSIFNTDGKINEGRVRIYRWKDTAWVQKGLDIEGGAEGDLSGWSISMSDSNTIAVGANRNTTDSIQAGRVRVHRWNDSIWVQKGADILGESNNDNFGYSVSMSDSNTISIGARDNDGNGTNSGHVRVYGWDGSTWVQKGADIDGESASDWSGQSISMPDTNTVAIGAPRNDGNGSDAGHVRIYRSVGNAWIQKGLDIEGDAADDQSGSSVSMPDRNTVAIAAKNHRVQGRYRAGHVRIFIWNGFSWTQKGLDIEDQNLNANRFGRSISMPDANTVVIGGNSWNRDFVRIFRWNGSDWIQKGIDFEADEAGDQFGYSVSMPDSMTVAIGAINNDSAGIDAGQAKVFWFCNTISTISTMACNPYTSPSGNHTWTTSGTYNDVIPNANGCDSLMIINLMIVDEIVSTIRPTTCDSFVSPSGNYTWTTSGTYIDTIPGFAGCDTITTIILTVNEVNTLVSKTKFTLTANASNATYQWINCDSSNIPVLGETSQSFTPSINGYYAVIVTQNACSDTSVCEGVFNVGIEEYILDQIKVYPNPSNEKVTIELTEHGLNAIIKVNSVGGKLVEEQINVNTKKAFVDLSNNSNGIYLISIQIKDRLKVIKLVKQ